MSDPLDPAKILAKYTRPVPRLRIGQKVRFKNGSPFLAKIVEFRGRIGPGGTHAYTLKYLDKRRSNKYITLPEALFEPVPAGE